MALLEKEELSVDALAEAWEPFCVPLHEAGVPKSILRAPMIAKLKAAGFYSLLDVRPCRAATLHQFFVRNRPTAELPKLSERV